MNKDNQLLYNRLFDYWKPFLKPGKEYYSYFIRIDSGGRGTGFHEVNKGEATDVVPDFQLYKNNEEKTKLKKEGLDIDDIMRSPQALLKNNELIYYRLSLENGFTYEIADQFQILHLIKQVIKDWLVVGVSSTILINFKSNNDYPELDVLAIHKTPTKDIEASSCIADELLICLYVASNPKIATLQIKATLEKVEYFSNPEIHGVTQPLESKKEELEINKNDLNQVYEFLESNVESKQEIALAILKQNSDFKKKAEKRYLKFIQNRVGKEYGLESFAKATLTRKEIELLSKQKIDSNQLSFALLDYDECQLIVDFIGSLVMNYVDIHTYEAQAKNCTSVEELTLLYNQTKAQIKAELLNESKNHNEGWFSSLSIVFNQLKVTDVLLERTSFDCFGESLKAFMFYLQLNSDLQTNIHVFQSDFPNLTSFFWLLPQIPVIHCTESSMSFPKSPLTFVRSATFSENGKATEQYLSEI